MSTALAPVRVIYKGLRRGLRILGRPVRRDRGLQGVVIQPYRGYGGPTRAYLMGRVFRQPGFGASLPRGTVIRELSDILRRTLRWGLGGVTVHARLGDVETDLETDGDGYFAVDLDLSGAAAVEPGWQPVDLRVVRHGQVVEDRGWVYMTPPTATLAVVSDIDDTVMETGVANKARMLWNLFVRGPESRVAFPGVTELYRALHEGPEGGAGNPMLYVSRAPWSIYEVLEAFFRLKDIPDGPILFLREWGLTLQRPLPRKAEAHKHDLIEGMLERLPDLPFVLIGDSGQHDPEVYADLVRRHPDRIRAVYIRDVSGSRRRSDEIEELAREARKAGTPLVLAADTVAMAKQAADDGLVSSDTPAGVRRERLEEAVD